MEQDLFPSVYRFLRFFWWERKKSTTWGADKPKKLPTQQLSIVIQLWENPCGLIFTHNKNYGVIVPTMRNQGNQIHPWDLGIDQNQLFKNNKKSNGRKKYISLKIYFGKKTTKKKKQFIKFQYFFSALQTSCFLLSTSLVLRGGSSERAFRLEP